MMLGRKLDADVEILCCDSVQVYRGMDIGSGKPTKEDQGEFPHHLLDLVTPAEHFHAAAWALKAEAAIDEVVGRGHLPIIVGGSGLYFRALTRGFFEAPPPDWDLRAQHKQYADEHGTRMLHGRLVKVDPDAAATIHQTDLVRISRALEIFEQTKQPISELRKRVSPVKPVDYFSIILDPPLSELRPRIDTRVNQMIEAGLADEVKRLCGKGYDKARAFRGAIGYYLMMMVQEGSLGPEAALETMKKQTVQYAKRQKTWFQKDTPRLRLAGPPDLGALIPAIDEWRRGP